MTFYSQSNFKTIFIARPVRIEIDPILAINVESIYTVIPIHTVTAIVRARIIIASRYYIILL